MTDIIMEHLSHSKKHHGKVIYQMLQDIGVTNMEDLLDIDKQTLMDTASQTGYNNLQTTRTRHFLQSMKLPHFVEQSEVSAETKRKPSRREARKSGFNMPNDFTVHEDDYGENRA